MPDKTSAIRFSIWNPGINLFMQMTFSMKAITISIVFILPILLLSGYLVRDISSKLLATKKETLGLAYARGVLPLLEITQLQREHAVEFAQTSVPPVGWDVAQASYVEKYQQLQKLRQNFGPDLSDTKVFDSIPATLPAPSNKGTDPSDELAIYTQFISNQLDLLQSVSKESGLLREADNVANNLAAVGLNNIPIVLDQTSHVLAASRQILKANEINPQQQRLISDRLPLIEYLENQILNRVEVSKNGNDLTKKTLNDVLPSTSEFRGLARHYFLAATVTGSEERFERATRKALTDYLGLQISTLNALDDVLNQHTKRFSLQRNVVLSITVTSLFLAIYLFIAFYFVTKSGLALISSHLHQMSEGDLRFFPNKPKGKDEPAMVLKDVHAAYESLHSLIRRVRHGARELRVTGDYISERSNDTAERTLHISETLKLQLTTMKQIAADVVQSADRTESVAKFSQENAAVAVRGGVVIDEVVETMHGIRASSVKIGDIIGVIDSIAFQTNILALNAAVEAARAGESGRGFAVVASEVRNLARRSAEAAGEIKQLISSSVERVNAGSKTVERAGNTMKEVVENANKMNQFLSEISETALQQSRQVESVSDSIETLNEETQFNLTMADKTKAAANSLLNQAGVLEQEIANFKVK
jgi:methyl-accepting chemotaxis protein